LAALSGAAAGATLGGVTGALVGLGIPEVEAKLYEGRVNGGNLLIAVHVETAEAKKAATAALKQAGAEQVSTAGEASVPKADSSVRR